MPPGESAAPSTGTGEPAVRAPAAASAEAEASAAGGSVPPHARPAASTTDIALHAPVTVWVIVIAVGLAVLGGLLAGAFGGWRASRLRPAAALRSVN